MPSSSRQVVKILVKKTVLKKEVFQGKQVQLVSSMSPSQGGFMFP